MVHLDWSNEVVDIEGACYLAAAGFCVICAALAAGMTMGLLSLDTLKLKIKYLVGSEDDKKAVSKILPLLENHHWLLCTLLLYNAMANEALPIFLDALVPSWAAVIISVTLVLLFGEIIPTALFTGPSQLLIAARFTPLVYFLRYLFFPVAYPMALVLDHLLGTEDEGDVFNRKEISAMMQIITDERQKEMNQKSRKKSKKSDEAEIMRKVQDQSPSTASFFGLSFASRRSPPPIITTPEKRVSSRRRPTEGSANASSHASLGSAADDSDSPLGKSTGRMSVSPNEAQVDEELSNAEMEVISGVLKLAQLRVRDVLIPLDKVDMLSSSQILNREVIEIIDQIGHSRLPVFRENNEKDIIGCFLVKRLMSVNPDIETPLSTLPLIQPIVIGTNDLLMDVMTTFKSGHTHLAIVSRRPDRLKRSILKGVAPDAGAEPIGILTVEDILEKMLQADIKDEADQFDQTKRQEASMSLREMSFNHSRRQLGPGYSASSSPSGLDFNSVSLLNAHKSGTASAVAVAMTSTAGVAAESAVISPMHTIEERDNDFSDEQPLPATLQQQLTQGAIHADLAEKQPASTAQVAEPKAGAFQWTRSKTDYPQPSSLLRPMPSAAAGASTGYLSDESDRRSLLNKVDTPPRSRTLPSVSSVDSAELDERYQDLIYKYGRRKHLQPDAASAFRLMDAEEGGYASTAADADRDKVDVSIRYIAQNKGLKSGLVTKYAKRSRGSMNAAKDIERISYPSESVSAPNSFGKGFGSGNYNAPRSASVPDQQTSPSKAIQSIFNTLLQPFRKSPTKPDLRDSDIRHALLDDDDRDIEGK